MRARATIATFEFTCGKCGETLAEPKTGSEFWTALEADLTDIVACEMCGHENTIDLPLRVKVE